jgi:hypothetical protein
VMYNRKQIIDIFASARPAGFEDAHIAAVRLGDVFVVRTDCADGQSALYSRVSRFGPVAEEAASYWCAVARQA